ncbi:MAG: abortive phage resistance protein [Firmicutes bacterium HGW-Firmicutes-17]|jgi:hypothetical protein|nr:MAG: abortive phage resistance protein [Firmicutes bacterium HGW-Firmicutes-17]
MRLKNKFGVRTPTKTEDEPRKKYFLVFEGEKTEIIYFDAVNDLREEIGINPLIELTPLIRSYNEPVWSNPKKILERILQNIAEFESGSMTYNTLINHVIDYLIEEDIIEKNIQAKSIFNILKWYCEEDAKKELTDIISDLEKECVIIASHLDKASCIPAISEDISNILKNQKITYDEDFDKICLIVDRDRKSFICNPKIDQYSYVLDTCKKKEFGFYVTNPCFEFWLLLHFDEVHTLDRTLLLENHKVKRRRTHAEQQLKKLMPGYQKSSYDAHVLVKKIDTAIKNSKDYCNDIVNLENTVGSNLGILIEEMLT